MTDSHTVHQPPVAIAADRPTHPLVRMAMQAGTVDPATLRDLIQVQREWEAGEAKKSFTEAKIALKRELPAVLDRDKTVRFETRGGTPTTYQHTTLAAAVDAVVPCLSNHGFSHAWVPRTGQNLVEVTCTLTHREGHSESATIAAPPDTSGSKNAGQAVASTITLLQRYTLLSLLGIATRDMRDPEPKVDTKVDVKKNLKAAGWLARNGVPVEKAEAHVQRSHRDWTADDLEALHALVPEAARPKSGDAA